MLDLAAASTNLGLAKLLAHGAQLVANDGRDACRLGQDVEQVFDFGHDLFVLGHDLVLFQSGQALQTHLQNLLRLGLRQTVQAVLAQTVFTLQTFGAVVVGVHHRAVIAGTISISSSIEASGLRSRCRQASTTSLRL